MKQYKPNKNGTINRCKVDGCNRIQKGKRLCTGHLQRLELWGDVRAHVPFQRGNPTPKQDYFDRLDAANGRS